MILRTYFDKKILGGSGSVDDSGDCSNRCRDVTDVVCNDFLGVWESLGTKKGSLRLAALRDGSPSPPGAWKRPSSSEMCRVTEPSELGL